MDFKTEKYNKEKHQKKLLDYMKNLENKFEYVPFIFSIEMIEVISTFKDVFLAIENGKIINLGYKNKIKSSLGFFFEKPKYDYDFLKEFDSIAVLFCPKEDLEKTDFEKKIVVKEAISNVMKVLSLEGSSFLKLRNQIKKVNKMFPDLVIEKFDKEKVSYEELKNFYEEWGESSRERISLYMCLYENYMKFIYDFGGDLRGVIAKLNEKIVGVGFYSISPSKEQAVAISCNCFLNFKGLNYSLTYEEFKGSFEKSGCKFMNFGTADSEGVIGMKKKFCFFYEDYFILSLKDIRKRGEGFWYNDCLDPDDFGLN